MNKPPEPKKAGRPALPPEARHAARFELRLTTAQFTKLQALGGAVWLRTRIDKAKGPDA